MLERRYLSVLGAKTREELHTEILRFTRQFEFVRFTAAAVLDRFGCDPEFIPVDNVPSAYYPFYVDSNMGKRDPVMQHCKRKSVPIIWNQITYINAGQADLWEQQAPFGYGCGITLAMHMPNGRHFVIGVDRDQPLPDDPAELSRMAADLHLLAVHAQEAATRVLFPKSPSEPEAPRLTLRELECLRWTMEGKTAWEVGHILSIAEHTVTRHIYNATHKLQSVNKHQAVLKALRLELIR